jgi:hypothetical protein
MVETLSCNHIELTITVNSYFTEGNIALLRIEKNSLL